MPIIEISQKVLQIEGDNLEILVFNNYRNLQKDFTKK